MTESMEALKAEIATLRQAQRDAEERADLEHLIATWWADEERWNPLSDRIDELARLDLAISQRDFTLNGLGSVVDDCVRSMLLYQHIEEQLGVNSRALPQGRWPTVTEVAVSAPGEKASKPRQLKGVAVAHKIVAGRGKKNPPSAQIFLPDDGSIWVRHPDWFSPDVKLDPALDGAPLEERLKACGIERSLKRFVYVDAWGRIIRPVRAWLKIDGLCPGLPFAVSLGMIMRSLEHTLHLPAFFLETGQWQRFFGDLIQWAKEELACDHQCTCDRVELSTDEESLMALQQYIAEKYGDAA